MKQNAFSERLHKFGFNLFTMLVVDLLHEFELGVWKAIFTHLLRMLESLKGGKLHELDRRCDILNSMLQTTQLTRSLLKDIARSPRLAEIQSVGSRETRPR